MITDFIINLIMSLPLALLDSLPSVDVTIPENVFSSMTWLLSTINYLFPVKALLPILIISFSITTFKIAYAIVLRVKSFIPTMGD